MTLPVRESVGQSGGHLVESERQETKFERTPWIRITQSERKAPLVTMWDGVKAIVIALSFADGNPEDIQISIVENCLLVRGPAQKRFVRQDIDLPCPVETRPIRIEDDKGTIYVLLQKK
jgi:HSP20 family molecular chaperone IbpA